jgi:hypothetical protein
MLGENGEHLELCESIRRLPGIGHPRTGCRCHVHERITDEIPGIQASKRNVSSFEKSSL